jgi:SAM-dependent methyltransferase
MEEPTEPPPTRWEQQVVGERWTFYTDRFDAMTAEGADLEGEARFVDAMSQRGSAVLDAGCGTGRIAAALVRMGHRAIGVDKDQGLIDIATSRYPGVPYLASDLLLLTPELSQAAGGPSDFDIIALPGNVLVYLAPGSERRLLTVLTRLLRPAGRIVAGFATDRDYSPAQLIADAAAVGLTVEHRFATWHLDPWHDDADWLVVVLRAPGRPQRPDEDSQWPAATGWPAVLADRR